MRNGRRKTRNQFPKRNPELGYYLIFTDTAETEKNYFNGLKASLPPSVQDKIVVKVIKSKTKNLVEDALNYASKHAQYCEVWIVFDRDKVTNFDEIISQAEKHDVKTGWSNPCIEIWFYAYFGEMPSVQSSVTCCKKFGEIFERTTKQEYKKSDDRLYNKLTKYGDEKTAIKRAEQKFRQQTEDKAGSPSDMYSCTTVYKLVSEIADKKNIT